MRSFSQRFVGAMRLDPDVYEEVEADHGALGQALAVVVISSLASGLGVLYSDGVRALVASTGGALLTWFVAAGITYFVGTRILSTPDTSSSWGELLRTLGFASAPLVFNILSGIPLLGAVIFYSVGVWWLVATVIAVRQALDYRSTWRAVAVCVTGYIVYQLAMRVLVPGLG